MEWSNNCSVSDLVREFKEILVKEYLISEKSAQRYSEWGVQHFYEKKYSQKLSRHQLFAPDQEFIFSKKDASSLRDLWKIWGKKIQNGYPIQYLMGCSEFYGRTFKVGEGVLIPRPETELFVDKIIPIIEGRNFSKGLEVGAGSGAISITLCSEITNLNMYATESSAEAIRWFELNQSVLANGKIQLLSTQMNEILSKQLEHETFDFLVSNPPYLSREDEVEPGVLLYEPSEALFLEDPMRFYRVFADQSSEFLCDNGMVFCEIPHERADLIARLFTKKRWKKVQVKLDFTSRPRFLFAERS